MSRRRSFTRAIAQRPDPVFFVDADLSDKVFHAVLAEAGVAFEKHSDHFVEGTKDPVWLRRAGENQWIVLSHNKKIRRNSAQTDILMRYGVRAFMLIGDAYPNPAGRRSAFTLELAQNFVRTLPSVLRFLRRHPSPWIAKLYRPPQSEERRELPGSIKMWLTMQQWLKER